MKMQTDFGGRQSGKTYRMVMWAIDTDAIVVVPDYARKMELLDQYAEDGLKPGQIVTSREAITKPVMRGRSPHTPVGVDDVGLILQQVLNIHRLDRISGWGTAE